MLKNLLNQEKEEGALEARGGRLSSLQGHTGV